MAQLGYIQGVTKELRTSAPPAAAAEADVRTQGVRARAACLAHILDPDPALFYEGLLNPHLSFTCRLQLAGNMAERKWPTVFTSN